MCSCQAYGKSGVPNARGFCLVCGERVEARVEADDPPDDGPLGVRGGTDYDGRDGAIEDQDALRPEYEFDYSRARPNRFVACAEFRPDHNGECLLCDEWMDAHTPEAIAAGEQLAAGLTSREGVMHMQPEHTAADYCQDRVGHGCFAIDLDGQVQAFVPSVRDRLIERGVLHLDAERVWRLDWHGFDLEKEHAADMSCCDFCSARPVTWVVPCVTFDMPDIPGIAARAKSQGDWAACEPCGAAIDARDKSGLLTRAQNVSAVKMAAAIPGLAKALKDMKRELHRRFWAHYQGGAVRIPSHPYGH
jgi:hypothetical protein